MFGVKIRPNFRVRVAFVLHLFSNVVTSIRSLHLAIAAP